jgi:hypothetical protein
VERVSSLIIKTLESLLQAADPFMILSKHKAICTIVPFAVSLEQHGQQGMVDLALRAVEASRSPESIWCRVYGYIAKLFERPSPSSIYRVIALTAHYWGWGSWGNTEIAVVKWETAILEVPYTEETCQSAVATALQVVHDGSLRPHIPVKVWAWLKKQPILPPQSEGRTKGPNPDVISHIRGLGDIEILKSYLVLLWSEWKLPSDEEIDATGITIRKDFCGTRMEQHRKDLVRRLDHVLGELDRGWGYFSQHTTCYPTQDEVELAKGRYGKLKDVLLEVEREGTMKALTRTSLVLTLFGQQADFRGRCVGYHSTCALSLPCP